LPNIIAVPTLTIKKVILVATSITTTTAIATNVGLTLWFLGLCSHQLEAEQLAAKQKDLRLFVVVSSPVL
jgi:hypothetical protein